MGDKVATSIMTQGLTLSFLSEPPLSLVPPPEARTSQSQVRVLEPFMDPWAEQRFIREIRVPQPLFFSRMFSVPKKSGKRRPIIDLSLLNRRLKIPRFKMETIEVIVRTIHGELWGCSVDIVDAYLHLPLGWEFHKFFSRRWNFWESCWT